MIEIKNLHYIGDEAYLENLSLEIRNGEVFFLLIASEPCRRALFDIMAGFLKAEGGTVHFNQQAVCWPDRPREAVLIDRIGEESAFETGVSLRAWIDFVCRGDEAQRQSIFSLLLDWNFSESQIKKKISALGPDIFRMAHLAILLACDRGNVVINDFLKGQGKEFEIFFDRLLDRKKEQGQAILYLSDDIFYACKIADRVQFIKNGRLVPSSAIPSLDLKKMDVRELFDKYLS